MPTDDPLAALRPLGPVLDPDMIAATYAAATPHAVPLDPATTTARYDLSYGPAERNRLDLYTPADGKPTAIVVYIHGGGFAGGDKGGPGKPFFANVGAWAVAEGFAAAAMTYRLVPEASWPSGAEDIAAAVSWLAENVASVPIVLAGQSAGAVHVADYLAGRAGPVHDAVAGAVLMSGIYDYTRHARRGFEDGYFGTDETRFAEHSTLSALVDQNLPLMFTVAELDPPEFQRQAAHVVTAWMDRHGTYPPMHYLPAHNHISPALLLGTPHDSLGPPMADFVRAAAA